MTTRTDPAAVDANVLVYAHYAAAPQHAASRALVDSAADPAADLCLFPQTLAEFFAIVTNPKRVSHPMTAAEAVAAVEVVLTRPGLRLLPVPAGTVAGWLALVKAKPVTRGAVFDLQLAAAMTASGVATLYTYNTADFASVPGVVAVEPPPAGP